MRTVITVAACVAVLFTATACEQDPPEEITVKLDDGTNAHCIVVKDSDSGDIESLDCRWPEDKN